MNLAQTVCYKGAVLTLGLTGRGGCEEVVVVVVWAPATGSKPTLNSSAKCCSPVPAPVDMTGVGGVSSRSSKSHTTFVTLLQPYIQL